MLWQSIKESRGEKGCLLFSLSCLGMRWLKNFFEYEKDYFFLLILNQSIFFHSSSLPCRRIDGPSWVSSGLDEDDHDDAGHAAWQQDTASSAGLVPLQLYSTICSCMLASQ